MHSLPEFGPVPPSEIGGSVTECGAGLVRVPNHFEWGFFVREPLPHIASLRLGARQPTHAGRGSQLRDSGISRIPGRSTRPVGEVQDSAEPTSADDLAARPIVARRLGLRLDQLPTKTLVESLDMAVPALP
jgi:hypothetical protein